MSHHLVSQVRGHLRQGVGPFEVLKDSFPGGSITGAPKIRAMELIASHEPTRRGPYCGGIGYIGFDGVTDITSPSAPPYAVTGKSASKWEAASPPPANPTKNTAKP